MLPISRIDLTFSHDHAFLAPPVPFPCTALYGADACFIVWMRLGPLHSHAHAPASRQG
jgi:hypothetical protein